MSISHALPRKRPPATALRLTGAAALLLTGAVHLQQYEAEHFSVIPTIGPLFLASFVGATLLAVLLALPRAPLPSAWRQPVDALLAAGGIGLSLGALAALLISERAPLFGFMEHGYRFAIALAIAAEAVATVSLAALLALVLARRRSAEVRA